jgi:hypothetical protein
MSYYGTSDNPLKRKTLQNRAFLAQALLGVGYESSGKTIPIDRDRPLHLT